MPDTGSFGRPIGENPRPIQPRLLLPPPPFANPSFMIGEILGNPLPIDIGPWDAPVSETTDRQNGLGKNRSRIFVTSSLGGGTSPPEVIWPNTIRNARGGSCQYHHQQTFDASAMESLRPATPQDASDFHSSARWQTSADEGSQSQR